MRIAHIHDPLIGVVPDFYLSAVNDDIWQKARIAALKDAFESAEENKAEYIILSGHLFGEVYVTNATISEIIDIVAKTKCKVIWKADAAGVQYLKNADNLPDNFIMLTREQCSYTSEDICAVRWPNNNDTYTGCNILYYDADELISQSMLQHLAKIVPQMGYIIAGGANYLRENKVFIQQKITKIENSGFEDTEASGYYLLDYDNGKFTGKTFIEQRKYSFKTVCVAVEDADDQKNVQLKCIKAAAGLADHDFVRIVLTGNVDVKTFINVDDIRDNLKNRYFYLEIFNRCELILDEEEYAADISLKSEFIRMVMADDTLSQNEKSRIVQCGWNALAGKELSE